MGAYNWNTQDGPIHMGLYPCVFIAGLHKMGLYRGAYNPWGLYNWNILDGPIYMGAYIHGGLKLEYCFGFIAGGVF